MQAVKSQEQKPKIVWQPLDGSQALALACPCHHILYEGTRGPGKAILLEEKVLTNSGWKEAGSITYDDLLVAPDGTYTRLAGIFPQGKVPLVKILFDEGQTITCSYDHRWYINDGKNNSKWWVRDINWLLPRVKYRNQNGIKARYQTPRMSNPAPGRKWTVGLDPYLAGLLLGDGCLSNDWVVLYSADEEIIEYGRRLGWIVKNYDRSCTTIRAPSAIVSRLWKQFLGEHKREHKCVPEVLLLADPDTRLALLQGLLDSDGTVDDQGRIEFVSTSEHLAKAVQYLVRSFGGKSTYHWRERLDGIEHRNGLGGRFKVWINLPDGIVPFRLTRKASRIQEKTRKSLNRGILDIQEAGEGKAVCFAVDHPSHQFVIDGFVVTHNTDAQIMYFRKYVGLGYGKFWRGVIFDREYKNLDDLVSKSQRWFPRFQDGAKFHASKADYRWTWPTGEELLFRQVKKLTDYWGYHGQEFPFIGWNELSKYPTSELYDQMMSCNRSSFLPEEYPLEDGTRLPKIPLVVFSTTNPYGAGHNWVKTRFIDVAPPGVVVRKTIDVFNPQSGQREPLTTTQVRIFGSYKENKYLDPKYVAELESIKDPNKRKAWLWGDWDVVAGGALDDVWNTKIHILPRFKIPEGWRIDRSMDWGSTHPFSIGWWAEANGEEVTLPNFRVFCPPKGSLIRIHEWYGTDELGSNKGLKMSAVDVARGIKRREDQLLADGWIKTRPSPGPADNQIFEVREKESDTIAHRMASQGIEWERSDKSPGSRKNGLQLLRDRLEASIRGEEPGIYFMEHCVAANTTLPVLPRDENNSEDVDTDSEDHPYDDTRYRVLAGNNRYATVIQVKFAR